MALSQRIGEEQAQGRIAGHIDPQSTARQLIAMADGLQLQSLVNPSVNALQYMLDSIAELRRP
jgi:hypothetical protein